MLPSTYKPLPGNPYAAEYDRAERTILKIEDSTEQAVRELASAYNKAEILAARVSAWDARTIQNAIRDDEPIFAL